MGPSFFAGSPKEWLAPFGFQKGHFQRNIPISDSTLTLFFNDLWPVLLSLTLSHCLWPAFLQVGETRARAVCSFTCWFSGNEKWNDPYGFLEGVPRFISKMLGHSLQSTSKNEFVCVPWEFRSPCLPSPFGEGSIFVRAWISASVAKGFDPQEFRRICILAFSFSFLRDSFLFCDLPPSAFPKSKKAVMNCSEAPPEPSRRRAGLLAWLVFSASKSDSLPSFHILFVCELKSKGPSVVCWPRTAVAGKRQGRRLEVPSVGSNDWSCFADCGQDPDVQSRLAPSVVQVGDADATDVLFGPSLVGPAPFNQAHS